MDAVDAGSKYFLKKNKNKLIDLGIREVRRGCSARLIPRGS